MVMARARQRTRQADVICGRGGADHLDGQGDGGSCHLDTADDEPGDC
jgi:hypothetical protein